MTWREELFEAVHEALYQLDVEWSDRVAVQDVSAGRAVVLAPDVRGIQPMREVRLCTRPRP